MTKVLILGSNPIDTERVRIDWEAKKIEERLERDRERFNVVTKLAVSTRDVIPLLRREEPQILHISAHGTKDGTILFESHDGAGAHAIDIPTFAKILTELRVKIDCVVLNACFSAAAIETLFSVVDAVVAMNEPISDDAALSFAYGFYHALADRRSIGDAFTEGRLLVFVEHPDYGEVPQLRTRNDLDPSTLYVTMRTKAPEPQPAPSSEPIRPAKPVLRAEFQRDRTSRRLKHRDTHYEIRLFVRDAPSDVRSVAYHLHPSFREPIRVVARDDEPDFSEYITSYGDFKVKAVLKGPSEEREISLWLSNALAECHKELGDVDATDVRRALKTVEAH